MVTYQMHQYHTCENIQQLIGNVCLHFHAAESLVRQLIIVLVELKSDQVSKKNFWDVHEPKTWTKSQNAVTF